MAATPVLPLPAFLSTLSLRRATRRPPPCRRSRAISIHALRPGRCATRTRFLSTLSLRRATCTATESRPSGRISIHALLAESDRPASVRLRWRPLFLSTLSLRRATIIYADTCFRLHYFYPRSPCGERQSFLYAFRANSNFYPRSPCGERLALPARMATIPRHFYPRSPCGERHVLRFAVYAVAYFYPRSPCGERPSWCRTRFITSTFLSTLSLRRATVGALAVDLGSMISIHALLAESDPINLTVVGRTWISIHALLAESD